MSNIIQISDFTGSYYLAVNDTVEPQLQLLIDKYEKKYLTILFGVEFRDLFIANLVNGVPTDTDYLKLYNEFFEVICESTIYSKGLKECLLGLVYYEIVRSSNIENTLTGLVYNNNENSERVDNLNVERFAETKRNESVQSFNSISYKAHELDFIDFSNRLEYKFLDLV